MSNAKTSKSLSGNILKMKFMQRGHEAELREEAKRERERLVKESQWTLNDDRPSTKSLVFVEQTTLVKDQLGRRSFSRFNLDIERLQEAEKKRQRQEREKAHQNVPKSTKVIEVEQQAPDVSDIDMAEQFVKYQNKKRSLSTLEPEQPTNKKMKLEEPQKFS